LRQIAKELAISHGTAASDLSGSTWREPLPPPLWERLPEKTRTEHQRLVAPAADEQVLRDAVIADRKPPKPKVPALAERAADDKRSADAAAKMVIEHSILRTAPAAGELRASESIAWKLHREASGGGSWRMPVLVAAGASDKRGPPASCKEAR
jgi:hypothetical protein